MRGIRRPRGVEHAFVAAMGLTGVAGYQLLLSAGEATVPAGTAALLFAGAPVLAVALAGAVLRERVGLRAWCGLAVALAGAAVVAAGQEGTLGAGAGGVALVAGAAASYAIWIVVQKRALTRMTGFEATAWSTWAGAALAVPFAGDLPHAIGSAPPSAWLGVVFLGVGISVVPFLLWAWVLGRTQTSVAAPALLLVGPAGMLIAWIALGEAPTVLTLAGGAITLAGVAAAVLRPRPPASPLSAATAGEPRLAPEAR
jgi:drug/metabolite transporter (DMT)-like permease